MWNVIWIFAACISAFNIIVNSIALFLCLPIARKGGIKGNKELSEHIGRFTRSFVWWICIMTALILSKPYI